MARATANKLYRNFVKGLITEASELTYPENACFDLDNCVIEQKGNIRRRLGIDYEEASHPSHFGLNTPTTHVFKEYTWNSVATRPGLDFLVTQTDEVVRFYDANAVPISSALKTFDINMLNYLAPNVTLQQAQTCELEFFSGKGYLWIVGKRFEPLIVSYDPLTDAITVQPLFILIRDFTGVDDGLANDTEPATLSVPHHYNLLNQGWVNPNNTGAGASQLVWDSFGNPGVQGSPGNSPITDYFAHASRYPGNNKQWWIARHSTSNAFQPSRLETLYFGTSRAPRGHFILNAFYKDRSAVSTLAGIPVESTDARPTSGTFFSGRAWYAINGQVFFSQVLDNKAKAGLCFQEADPTAEGISDLIATDGGAIPIPEMGEPYKMLPVGPGVLILADNGIWFISGGDTGFSALDFIVTRVSSVGVNSPNSIVDTKRGIAFWDRVGIRVLTVGGQEGFQLQTISEETIQSYVQDTVPTSSKPKIKGVYDTHENIIQWLYDSSGTGGYTYDRILNLDLTLGSFYPFSFSTTGPRITGAVEVKDGGIVYRTAAPVNNVWREVFSKFRDDTFADFRSMDGAGQNYLSFLESGYELLDDTMRRKKQNYIFCYFRKTEEEYDENDEPTKPSSCFFQTKWDWADTQDSNRWTNKIQAYRHLRLPVYNEDDPSFNTGHSIVVTKNKVRGHGRAIQFRFESGGIGKDFDLLGWAVAYSGNTNP